MPRIGDRVIITRPNSPWLSGRVLYVRSRDSIRLDTERALTHFVKYDDAKARDYYGAWYDPAELTVTQL